MKPYGAKREPSKRAGLVRKISLYLGLVGATLFLSIAPSPYLVEAPGPVYDVLSTVNGEPIITIKGAKSYPTYGQIDLLTVTIKGDEKRGASWYSIIESFFVEGSELVDIADVYPPGVDSNQRNQEADIMMLDSQASAKGAALRELGYEIKTNVKVSVVTKNGAAGGILKAGDTLLKVDGEIATGIDQVRAQVAASKGKRPVVLEVLRDGKTKTFEITPTLVDGNWRLGIFVANVPEIPIDISINLDNVGGPSGGQSFALAIYELMTPDPLIRDLEIAATGTIDVDGSIGPIGGIKQKLIGAKNAGAKYFLAPEDNCSEVKGNIPEGLKVFPVANLKESINAIKAIRIANSSSLRVCK